MNGDLAEALHFKHFEKPAYEAPIKLSGRIKLSDKVVVKSRPHIILHDSGNPTNTANKTEEKPEDRVAIKVNKKK
jgi:hypothetical protein